MNQAELRQMAKERVKDAKALLGRKRWEFAYYSAGYAVECALKSCVLARMIYTALVFKEGWSSKECLTHKFEKLIDLAGLREELNRSIEESAAEASDERDPRVGAFVRNWGTVKVWDVASRYESRSEAEARALYDAITDKTNGVMRWIQKFW